jgi:proline iminopeptidase
MKMQLDFLETDCGKIWYSVYSEDKTGIPLVVVHGGSGFLSMPQIIGELSADRPVYLYDQLGCGKFDKFDANDYYSVKNYVNELDEVIRKLKLSEFVLMGFSWGCGLVCSYMLEKDPKGVKALILSTPCSNSPLWDKDRQNNMARIFSDVKRLKKEKKMLVVLMNARDRLWRIREGNFDFIGKYI